jgi:threonylcarbamoyladenosine tRNA methylthiotransferase MtaB
LPTAAFYTLGCKVNQYETEKIREEMESLGFQTVPYPGPADVIVVNSCTVTGTADAKSRAAVRRAIKRNPDAVVVATGCSVELDPHTFAQIEGVDVVVPNAEKAEIAERVAARFADLCPETCFGTKTKSRSIGDDQGFGTKTGSRSIGVNGPRPRLRTRALVKVQDGCNQFCAYCAVPLARPNLMSRELEDIEAEVRSLADFGYKEVVLTGIRLGSYSTESAGLPELVSAAAKTEGIERVRLSSIEVWEITPALIEALKHPKVCRHLHVPLQSGSDGVLKAMGRPYDAETYRRTVHEVRQSVDGLGVTTDVMVGFPGETEEDFRRTYELVEEVRFSRLHVFRYSARPGTRAAKMADQTAPAVKERRSAELIRLGERLSGEFAASMAGKVLSVLVERRRSRASLLSGLTDNYVEVEFAGPDCLRGEIARVKVTGRRGNILMGEVV